MENSQNLWITSSPNQECMIRSIYLRLSLNGGCILYWHETLNASLCDQLPDWSNLQQCVNDFIHRLVVYLVVLSRCSGVQLSLGWELLLKHVIVALHPRRKRKSQHGIHQTGNPWVYTNDFHSLSYLSLLLKKQSSCSCWEFGVFADRISLDTKS